MVSLYCGCVDVQLNYQIEYMSFDRGNIGMAFLQYGPNYIQLNQQTIEITFNRGSIGKIFSTLTMFVSS